MSTVPVVMSPASEEEVKLFEAPGGKPVLKVYLDPGGVKTGGWGHTKGLAKLPVGTPIPEDLAEKWLQEDLADAEQAVNELVKVPLDQDQHDALDDFVFNLGRTNFAGSTLLKVLNRGRYDLVPAELKRWNHDRVNGKLVELPGLTKRRAWEAALFARGTATLTKTPAPAPVPAAEFHPTATVIPAKPKDGWSLVGAVIDFLLTFLTRGMTRA